MGGGLTNLWAILLKQETYRRPLELSSFLLSFCYSAVMDVFLLSCNYLSFPLWVQYLTKGFFAVLFFPSFPVLNLKESEKWPERLKYNDYRLMYRQIPFSCNHLQTTVDVMFPTETSLNETFFSVWRSQESNSVLCISGPFTEETDVGLCFFYMRGLPYFVDGTPGIPVWGQNASGGFPVSVVIFPASPCLYIWNHAVADGGDASLSLRHFQHCSIHHCCPAQLWNECAVHTDEWSCNSLCRLCFVIFHLLGF